MDCVEFGLWKLDFYYGFYGLTAAFIGHVQL